MLEIAIDIGGTNAILEHKGAIAGVLMTAGFEDALEIGRQKRSTTVVYPGQHCQVDSAGNLVITVGERA